MSVTVGQILAFLERWAPSGIKQSYDNVGLVTGSTKDEVSGILITLDLTEDVIQEAIARDCSLIIAHHPIIFPTIQHVQSDRFPGNLLTKLIKSDLAFYVSHTNLDAARNGVSFALAHALGLTSVGFLAPTFSTLRRYECSGTSEEWTEFTEFVQEVFSTELVSYSSSSHPSHGWFMADIETFSAHKHILTTRFPTIHLIEQEVKTPSKQWGIGCIGQLKEEGLSQNEFLEHLTRALNTPAIRFSGSHSGKIKTVAVCGGAGASLQKQARSSGADAYVTSDIKYHDFQPSPHFLLVDVGHYESEIPMIPYLAKHLRDQWSHLQVHTTTVCTNPMHVYVSSTSFKNPPSNLNP